MVKVWRPTSGDVFKYPEQTKKSKFKQIAKVSFLTALGASVLGLIGFLFNDRANLGNNIKDLKKQFDKLEKENGKCQEYLESKGKDFSPCNNMDECNDRLNHLEHIVSLGDKTISNCLHITGMTADQLLKHSQDG